MSSISTESLENICVVCFKNVDIFSIGSCDHMVCYECSTRMRVLCRQNDCPICRQDLPRVVFTRAVKPFSEIQNCSSLEDKKFKICFQNKDIQDAFYKLLEHCCSVCPSSPSFKTFQYLEVHMRKEHNLYYCDLCVEHLKIFSSERQCYTKENLDHHQQKGDVDDRSHRGHPMCRFCETRYMDNDDLYRHLRRDHLFCHFCDADGFDLYYSSYDYLLEHFRTEHYLCEEGSCVDEKFTPVFRTDIDLKAHRASAHGRTLGKAAAKQARTLELEFTLKPRPNQQDGSRRGKLGHNCESFSHLQGAVGGEPPTQMILPKLDFSNFPSLPTGPGSSVPTVIPLQRGHSSGLTIHAVGRRNAPLTINDENFPALGVYNDSSVAGTSVRLDINQDRSASGSGKGGTSRNVSIHVNHKPNGEQKIRIRQNDFPALSSEKKPQSNLALGNWAVVSSKKSAAAAASTSKASAKPPSRALLEQDFPCLNSKFSTNLNLKVNEPSKPNFESIKRQKENKSEEQKAKKASSVTIPVQGEVAEASENGSKTKSKKKKSKSSNVEEKSDTAKKKNAGKESETKSEESGSGTKRQAKSALTAADASETPLTKPLPSAEDWFEGLRKTNGKSEKKEGNESNKVCSTSNSTKSNAESTEYSAAVQSSNDQPNKNCSNSSEKKITSKVESKPPPGFDNFNGCFSNSDGRNPPPGFGADFPRSNGLTFTNSSGQSFAIPTDFQYVPPADFELRNQNLVLRVNKIILNESELEQFRKKSILFRQDLLSAKEYYDHCIKTMGDTGLEEIFSELLILLPDINKQQELLQVYSQSKRFSKHKKNLESCTTCRQVLSKSEIKQHLVHHSVQQNFSVAMADQWTK